MIRNSNAPVKALRRAVVAVAASGMCLGYAQAAEIEIGGHLMVTGSHYEAKDLSGESDKISDLNVNSLELGIRFSPLRQADVNVVWLLEEEPGGGSPDQGFVVDQAFVTISGNGRVLAETPDRDGFDDSPWYLQAGKMYIPFSTHFEYHTFDVISEPETLQLGETLETALQVGYFPDGPVHVYGGIFGGRGADDNVTNSDEDDEDVGDAKDDRLNDFYFGAAGDFGWGNLAATWVSNINNSIALVDELDAAEDAVGGLDVYAGFDIGPARLQLNYVSAMDDYTQGNYEGLQPSAINAELTFDGLMLADREWAVTAVFGQTDEWVGHPETTYGLVVDTALADGITLSAQYLRRDYDEQPSGLDSDNLIALQLTTEFGWVLGR